jgi:hypothetical protein
LLLKQPPKTVIFAVDFWTFCTTKEEFPPFARPTGTYHDGLGDPNRALLLWRLFAEEKLSAADLWKIFQHALRPPQRALPRTGISSLITDNGFGPDGSLFSLSFRGSVDSIPAIENRSRVDIDAVRRGAGRIPAGCRVSEENLALLGLLGTELARHGIDLIVIAPPVTTALLRAIDETPAAHAYMTTWRQRLKEA